MLDAMDKTCEIRKEKKTAIYTDIRRNYFQQTA